MRSDAYLIVTGGRRLQAPTLEELAEIAACAIDAGDRIELLRAQEAGRLWPLRDEELERFLRSFSAQLR